MRNRMTFPAVKAIDNSASAPQPNAKPNAINWFPRYERLLGNRHTRFKATSSGIKMPVEVISRISSENNCARCRAPDQRIQIADHKILPRRQIIPQEFDDHFIHKPPSETPAGSGSAATARKEKRQNRIRRHREGERVHVRAQNVLHR